MVTATPATPRAQLFRRQCDRVLFQHPRSAKLLIALDLLPPHTKAVAIPTQNLQRVIATSDEHIQRLGREPTVLHPFAHPRRPTVAALPPVPPWPVQLHPVTSPA